MIYWSVLEASLAGVAVIMLGNMSYLALSYYELPRLLLLGTPGLAAFVAAYWSPRWKMAVGMSMAVYGAVLGELIACVYEHFGGRLDHIGGVVATLFILLVYNSGLSVIGSFMGIFFSKKGQRPARHEQ